MTTFYNPSNPWTGGYTGIPAGFELPSWAGGNLQTFLNSANPQSFPTVFQGAGQTASPEDIRTLPESNQPIFDWLNDYRDLRQPGWDIRTAANPQWGDSSFFNAKKGVTNNQANFLQDMFLGYDFPRIQGAADRQFTRVNEAIGRMGETNTTNAQRLRDVGNQGAQNLRDLSTTVGEGANRYGAAAVADAQEAVRRSDELAGSGTQSAVAGYERNVRNQLALMRSGTNPDGSPMTAEQYAAVQQQTLYDTAAQGAQIRSQYEASANQMRSQLSQVQLGAGNLSANVAQISSALNTQAEQLRMSAFNAAAQLEAQGRKDEASLLLANPESVVSVSNALLNMWGVFLGASPTQSSGQGSIASTIAPIAGALIGSVIAPGAGTAVGGAIGAGIGGAAGGGGGGNGTFMNW